MKKSTIYIFVVIFILVLRQGFAGAQASFDIDFLNLKQAQPTFFEPFKKIQIDDAWAAVNKTNLMRFVKVGIIDSGIDALGERHPEFRGVDLGNTPDASRVDTEPPDIPTAAAGHGTQVAGIMGANNISFPSPASYVFPHMNGVLSGVHGLNYTLEVRRPTLIGTSLLRTDAWSLFTSINKLAAEGVDVINISASSIYIPIYSDFWFLPTFSLLDNILFVVSAGQLEFDLAGVGISGVPAEAVTPASYGDNFDNVITVGALNLDDTRMSSSNFGSAVNIAAPGLPIYAPAPRGKGNFPADAKDYDNSFAGTSASAPLVTGVAAILKAINPNLSPSHIKQILIETADLIQTDKPIGPRLNAFRAVCHPLTGLQCEESVRAVRPGFDANILPANDDGSAGPVPIGFTLNFFGVDHGSLFVNNNGNFTFNSPLSAYTPFNLIGLGQPIIAPFFADVDTRAGNVVTYGPGTVSGRPAFGANWPDVGCFSLITSVLNDFQVLLIDRSDVVPGDFDIEFNYDKIQWETGQASGGTTLCEGGIASRVGFSEGTGNPGTFFELPGSGIIGSFLDSNPITGLIHTSMNNDRLGRYLFEIRGGTP